MDRGRRHRRLGHRVRTLILPGGRDAEAEPHEILLLLRAAARASEAEKMTNPTVDEESQELEAAEREHVHADKVFRRIEIGMCVIGLALAVWMVHAIGKVTNLW
jgi:hypothetical protein